MSVLTLLDEEELLGWANVLPPSSIAAFTYPDVLLEWAPTTQPTDASQVYTPITERLRSWNWSYGRNDELARFEAGNGSVLLDNRDRALDPSYNAGAWYGNIKPRKMFRLRYRWNGTVYPGFVAYSRGLPQEWPSAGFDSVVKIDLLGAFAILQGVDLIVGFSRPVEDSGARIAAVLDAAGVPAALRDIDAGTVEVDALTIESSGTSALDHAKAVAEAEFGQLFEAKDGKVTFHNRARRQNAATLQAFTDDPAGLLRYGLGFHAAFDETYLWNYVRVETGEEASVSEDAASQDDYHKIVRTISSVLAHEPDRAALAEYQVQRYAQPELRAPELPLNGAVSPAAQWPVILDLEVSDRVTVTRFATAADPMVLTQNIEGVKHTCSPGGPWLSAFPTSPADTNQYWLLEDAAFGLLESTTYLAA